MGRNRPTVGTIWFYASVIAAIHVVAVALMIWGNANALLWSSALLAYTFGLRHAFDIDHITAIDNTVRKITGFHSHALIEAPHVHRSRRDHGTGVGFYFSLGHSSVVFLLSCALAFSASWAISNIPHWEAFGSIWGATISGLFLVVIGAINAVLWVQIARQFRRVRRGEEIDLSLSATQGILTRLFSKLFGLVKKSWHLFPLGFLFGLGFDTASEVALLSLSTQGALQSQSWQVLIALPLFFAAAMCTMDTADGAFMVKAYKWADRSPLKKVYYNLCITGLSVLVAFVVGGIELLQVISDVTGSNSGWGSAIQAIDIGDLGYALVGVFALFWLASWIVWKRIGRTEGERI